MKRTKTAFSIVEMILVLVIIAMMAVVAVPRYGQAIARQRLDAAVRRVIADLKYAQKRAIQTNTPQTVTFVEANSKYKLNQTPGLNDASRKYTVDLTQEPYYATIKNVEFRASGQVSGDPALVFDIYGTPDSGGGLRIVVGNGIADLTLDPQTGMVTTIYQ